MGKKQEICQQILSGQLILSCDEFGRPAELLPLLTHHYVLPPFLEYLCEETAGPAVYTRGCRLDGCIINVNWEVFHAGFCKMIVTWDEMDFIPLKATRDPDICVNELNLLCVYICVSSLCCAHVCTGLIFLCIHIQEFGGELRGITDIFELIRICLCKKYSLCIHTQ